MRCSGTLFEIGYAKAKRIPVVGLAERVWKQDLKMFDGTNCRLTNDFVTSMYWIVWEALEK
jgi:nucleoside 2-deoxyribosyltransferase